jgi:hypothetical protein
MIATIYNWFTDSFHAVDLKDAKGATRSARPAAAAS